MGSGVSVEMTNKAKELISIVSSDSSINRTNALKELWDLTNNDDHKKPLATAESGLLPVLVNILKDSNADIDTKKNASGCLWYLSRDNEVKLILAKEPDLIATCVSLLKSGIENNGIRIQCTMMLGNVALEKASHTILLSKDINLLPTLYDIINDSSNNLELREKCVKLIANICSDISKDNVQLMLDNNIHILVIDLLRPLDSTDTSSWPNFKSPDDYGQRCLILLMNLCRYEKAALAVKAIGGDDVLTPLVTIKSTKETNIFSSFAIAFVAGSDESKKATNKSSLLVSVPKTLQYLVDVFKNTLDLKGGPGYQFGIFKLPIVVGAISILTISDDNKKVLIDSPILDYLIKVLELFRNNEDELVGKSSSGLTERAGGGGKDIETASLAIEALVQLSFYYSNDDDLRNKYINPSYNITKLIDDLIEAPPTPLGQKDKDNLMVLRNRLVPVAISTISNEASNDISTSNVTVMISYAWEANKEHVVHLTNVLKQNNIDVWRDEDGSKTISKMGGDIMEKMAEVVSLSSVFIVCLSESYKRRPNCRSEGSLIRRKQNKGFKVIFLMMDSTFTDDVYDTWLGSMLASDLWYPLWDPSQINQTASTLIELISGHSVTITAPTIPTTPSNKLMNDNGHAGNSTPKQSKPADYEKAWSLLKPNFASLPSTLTTLLEELGVTDANDLSLLDDDVKSILPKLMKPLQRTKLSEALGY